MKYIVSDNGLRIAIGLVGSEQEALENRTLAENIFNIETNGNFFAGIMFMKDFKQFKKFLILKEYFNIWSNHFTRNRVSGARNSADIMKFTRRAIKQARLIIESSVSHEPFMRKLQTSGAAYAMGMHENSFNSEE